MASRQDAASGCSGSEGGCDSGQCQVVLSCGEYLRMNIVALIERRRILRIEEHLFVLIIVIVWCGFCINRPGVCRTRLDLSNIFQIKEVILPCWSARLGVA